MYNENDVVWNIGIYVWSIKVNKSFFIIEKLNDPLDCKDGTKNAEHHNDFSINIICI